MARICEYCADAVRTRPGAEHVQCATCGRRCTVPPELDYMPVLRQCRA